MMKEEIESERKQAKFSAGAKTAAGGNLDGAVRAAKKMQRPTKLGVAPVKVANKSKGSKGRTGGAAGGAAGGKKTRSSLSSVLRRRKRLSLLSLALFLRRNHLGWSLILGHPPRWLALRPPLRIQIGHSHC